MTPTATLHFTPTHAGMATLFDEYGAAWATRDPDAIAAFHAQDGIFHLHAGAAPVKGRAAIREAFAGFLAQWPDLAFEEESAELTKWGWTVRWTMSGTLAGALEIDGAEARRGSRMSIDAADVIEVSGGLITAKHTYLDALELMRQSGISS